MITIFLNWYTYISFVTKFSVSVGVVFCPPRCRPALQPTGWRLGAAAASTTFVAGDYLSITHKIFSGTTAPLAPNRSLQAVLFF